MNQFRKLRLLMGLGLALALAMTWQQSARAKAAEPVWQPVLDAPIELVNPYRQPNSDYSAGHRGVDYRVTLGQPIYSPTEAKVHFNSMLVDRPVLSLETSSGDLIEFEPACSNLGVGDFVAAGQEIGFVCAAKQNYKQHCQNCLHFSLRTSAGYLSPLVRIGSLSPSVLLPRY